MTPVISRRRFVRDLAGATAGATAFRVASSLAYAAPAPHSIGAEAAAHGIMAGCAVNGRGLKDDADFRQLVAAQAAIVVAENEMKWRSLRPTPITFDYTAADRFVDFAQQNDMRIRGHNLCWHQSLPDWFSSYVTRDNARAVLINHIQNVAGRYAGKMHSWDVVNEAVKLDDHRSDALRESPWLQLIGPGYIDLAFRVARDTDPHALLVYNDYGIENDNRPEFHKREAVFGMVTSLKKQGTPIDAVGIQSHLTAGQGDSYSDLRHFIRDLRKKNLDVFVTELDVNDSHVNGDFAKRDAEVAKVYEKYLDVVLGENARVVLTWGITDRYSWISHEHPRPDGAPARALPFDDKLQPVAAFNSMIGAFSQVRP
jgi:endo-1,4-beta-xylanase